MGVTLICLLRIGGKEKSPRSFKVSSDSRTCSSRWFSCPDEMTVLELFIVTPLRPRPTLAPRLSSRGVSPTSSSGERRVLVSIVGESIPSTSASSSSSPSSFLHAIVVPCASPRSSMVCTSFIPCSTTWLFGVQPASEVGSLLPAGI